MARCVCLGRPWAVEGFRPRKALCPIPLPPSCPSLAPFHPLCTHTPYTHALAPLCPITPCIFVHSPLGPFQLCALSHLVSLCTHPLDPFNFVPSHTLYLCALTPWTLSTLYPHTSCILVPWKELGLGRLWPW